MPEQEKNQNGADPVQQLCRPAPGVVRISKHVVTLVRSIEIESAHQTPFVPADAGTQTLLQKLGSRFRGNER
jgi:hypothetical protein